MLRETFEIIFKLQVINQIEKNQVQNIPKIYQVYLIIKEVKKQYPHLNFKIVLDMIHNQLVEYKQIWTKQTSQHIIAQKQEERLRIQRQTQQVINSQVVQILKKDKILQKQLHQKLLKRQQQKAFTAMLLIKRGYSLNYFRQQMASGIYQMKMKDVRYKTCCSSVVGQVFRKIQHFLKVQKKVPIKTFTFRQIRSAYHILLNYKTYLQKNQYETFLKFVKWCYKIQNVTLQVEETITLYQKVRDRLNRKVFKEVYGVTPYTSEKSIKQQTISMASMSIATISQQTQQQKMITEQFVDYYDQCNSICKCRDMLVKKYGSRRQFCQVKYLYSRLYKYFRSGFKKLMQLIPKYNINCQNIPFVNHQITRRSLSAPQALKFRKCLIKLMKTDRPTIQLIQQSVFQLQRYGRERLIQTISKQEEQQY